MTANTKSIKKEIIMVILYILYKLIIDIVYLADVNPIYNYMGLTLDVNIIKIVFSYGLLVIIAILRPKNLSRVSTYIIQLHLVVMIIPFLSFYGMGNQSTPFVLMVITSFLLQIFLLKKVPNISLVKIKNAKFIILIIIGIVSIVSYGYLIRTQGINFTALNINDIYKIRENRDISNIIARFITWQFRVINPCIIVYGYIKKNKKTIIIGVLLQFLMYLLYPNKEIFLSIGILMFALFVAYKNISFEKALTISISLGSIFASLIYHVIGNIIPLFLVVVRFLNIPAIIKFWHYDFFKVHEKLLYSEGMIGKFFGLHYPYDVASGYLIGRMGQANTGYIAYAYDNAGYFGMIMMSLFFVAILILLNSLTKGMNSKVILAFLIYPMIILNDTDLLTLITTGGIWISVVVLLLFTNIGNLESVVE